MDNLRKRLGERLRGITSLLAAIYLTAIVQPTAATADTPLDYLHGSGPRSVTALTWGLMLIALSVCAIVIALLVVAVWHKRDHPTPILPGVASVERPTGGALAIYIGVAVSAGVLLLVTIWTVTVLADIAAPATKPRVAVEITGHLWWWEVRYLGAPAETFSTANELRIPVGEPVSVQLKSNNVIHSFWIPKLVGKTDLIPGQVNRTWLQADVEGVYRGQCAEYCGLQHARMGLYVIASDAASFERWRRKQLRPATAVATPTARAGAGVFMQRCSVCHTVRGTLAGGIVGPDLTHLMSRRSIAAATLPNTPAALSAWIANPQAIKPGTKMPAIELSGPQLNSVRTYLATLK